MQCSGVWLPCALFRRSLFRRSLFHCSLFRRSFLRRSLFRRSLFNRSLFRRSLFRRSVFSRSLFRRSLFRCSLFRLSLFRCSLFRCSFILRSLFLRLLFTTKNVPKRGPIPFGGHRIAAFTICIDLWTQYFAQLIPTMTLDCPLHQQFSLHIHMAHASYTTREVDSCHHHIRALPS